MAVTDNQLIALVVICGGLLTFALTREKEPQLMDDDSDDDPYADAERSVKAKQLLDNMGRQIEVAVRMVQYIEGIFNSASGEAPTAEVLQQRYPQQWMEYLFARKFISELADQMTMWAKTLSVDLDETEWVQHNQNLINKPRELLDRLQAYSKGMSITYYQQLNQTLNQAQYTQFVEQYNYMDVDATGLGYGKLDKNQQALADIGQANRTVQQHSQLDTSLPSGPTAEDRYRQAFNTQRANLRDGTVQMPSGKTSKFYSPSPARNSPYDAAPGARDRASQNLVSDAPGGSTQDFRFRSEPPQFGPLRNRYNTATVSAPLKKPVNKDSFNVAQEKPADPLQGEQPPSSPQTQAPVASTAELRKNDAPIVDQMKDPEVTRPEPTAQQQTNTNIARESAIPFAKRKRSASMADPTDSTKVAKLEKEKSVKDQTPKEPPRSLSRLPEDLPMAEDTDTYDPVEEVQIGDKRTQVGAGIGGYEAVNKRKK